MKVLLGLFAVAVILLLPGIASANLTISYPTSTPIGSTATDWTGGTLTFQQFNPALGTLNSVTIGLSGGLSTVLTVTNSSGESSSGTGKTEVQMTVQDAGNNLINTPQLDLFSPDYSYSLGPGGSTTSGTLTKSGTSSDLYTLAAVLSEFTGVGTTSLNAGTFTQTWLTNTGGNTFASQVTSASLTGTVTYNYTPEPATMAMLGLGALGLAARRRRSR